MNFDVFLFEFLYDLLEFRTKFQNLCQSDTEQGATSNTLLQVMCCAGSRPLFSRSIMVQ